MLFGSIPWVVLMNSERLDLIGAVTASLGGQLWSCTVSVMRASRVSLLVFQHLNRVRSMSSGRFLKFPLRPMNTGMSEQHLCPVA